MALKLALLQVHIEYRPRTYRDIGIIMDIDIEYSQYTDASLLLLTGFSFTQNIAFLRKKIIWVAEDEMLNMPFFENEKCLYRKITYKIIWIVHAF